MQTKAFNTDDRNERDADYAARRRFFDALISAVGPMRPSRSLRYMEAFGDAWRTAYGGAKPPTLAR